MVTGPACTPPPGPAAFATTERMRSGAEFLPQLRWLREELRATALELA
ncbi:hypothetical protein [Nisaea sediminum]|nr:hypothetical protein [Nisaea sediminum]